MSCLMLCECNQILELRSEFSFSIFPKTSELLSNTDFQSILENIDNEDIIDTYRSLLDFLFCEIFIGFKEDCKKFYREEGLPLRKMKINFSKYDTRMCQVLEMLYCNKIKYLDHFKYNIELLFFQLSITGDKDFIPINYNEFFYSVNCDEYLFIA